MSVSLRAGGDKTAQRREEEDSSASAERVALIIVLQLVLVVLPQLSIPELPVHRAILAHVDDILVVILVVIFLTPQATFTNIHQLSLLEAGAGGACEAAVGRRAVAAPGTQLLVAAGMEVGGCTLGAGVPDEEDDSHRSQYQQDTGGDEDGQVTPDLLFLFVPECQVGGEDALSLTDRCTRKCTVALLSLLESLTYLPIH